VNVAGLQFPLDFVNGTMYLCETSSGIHINYVDFGDGFDYLSNIAQPASCYTFDIPYIPPIPPTPSITPTMTPTNTPITPTITPTMTPTPSSTPSGPQTPQTLGATWWIDFTDASTLTIDIPNQEILTATDKIAGVVFSADPGGPLYNATGYLGVSGSVRTNATQLRNSSGEYTQIGDYTWFVRIYDDPSAQRGGRIITGAANPGWPIGFENLLMIDNNSNPYPPGPVWIFQNNGVLIDGNISFSTWTDIAMRAYHTGSTLTLEVWENGSITYTNSVFVGSPTIIADEIFSLMFGGGIDFATEQFFFNRALNTGEMAQMFNYLTNKY
jgi:hypothetical protein